jgi:hypothetical protein
MSDDKREPLVNLAQSETPGHAWNFHTRELETPQVSGSIRPDRQEKATSDETSRNAGGEVG